MSTEKLHLPIVPAPATTVDDAGDSTLRSDIQFSRLVESPQKAVHFSLDSLPDDEEATASSISFCRKEKLPCQNKGVTQLRKFFYRKFKRRLCGVPSLGFRRISGKNQHKTATFLQIHGVSSLEPPSNARICDGALQQESPSSKASQICLFPREVLLQDIVNCDSPANLVRGGELSAVAEKASWLKPCTSTPNPIQYDWASRLTESPGLENFPHLQFRTHRDLRAHDGSANAAAINLWSRSTSSFLPSPSCGECMPDSKEAKNLKLLESSIKGNMLLNSSELTEGQLQKHSFLVDVHEKENMPLALGSNSKASWVCSSLRKRKRKRRRSQGQVLFSRQVSHGRAGYLQTRSCTRLDMDTYNRQVRSGPILRSSQHEILQDAHCSQRSGRGKLMKESSFSAYGSKKALVKALLEKYLRNRRLKCGKSGTPSCSETCLPFLNRKASRVVECFYCKTFVAPHEVAACSYKDCKRSYHYTCAQSLEDFLFRKNGDVVCPQHVCMVCKAYNKSKVLRCERCTVAAHKKCLAFPEHAIFFTFKPGCIICWRHPQDWRLESEHKAPTTDTKEAFKRLPVPYAPVEFSIGSGLQEEVSGNELEPAPFVHIRRNIFLVKKRRDDADDGVGCTCKSSCRDGCECRAQSMSCSKSCLCDEKCSNKPFRKEKKIKLVKTLMCGWGVQTVEAITKGEFIIEYVGEVINEAMCEERLWTMKERGDHNFYMCEIGKDFIIDATFKGNPSRFVNHSCDPNCNLEKWRVDGEIRVGIFAVRDIKDGEALTYDYRFIQFGPTVKCRCGASNCRGNLGESYQNKKTKPPSADVPPLGIPSGIPTWGDRQKRSLKQHDLSLIATS